MILSRRTKDICWICSEVGNLTGEHKIKKSDLERFRIEKPKLQKVETDASLPIQGPNSKYLKFPNSICAKCNNEDTQIADRAYDEFWNNDREPVRFVTGMSEKDKNLEIEHEFDLTGRIDLARYFGKHLGCALDYEKFPIPRRLSNFVIGRNDKLCITLAIRSAPFVFLDEAGKTSTLAGIGGAILQISDHRFSFPRAYQSAFIVGGVQFIVVMRLSFLEAMEIWSFYQKKFRKVHSPEKEDLMHRGFRHKDY